MIGLALEVVSTSEVTAPLLSPTDIEPIRLTVTTTPVPTLVDGRPQ